MCMIYVDKWLYANSTVINTIHLCFFIEPPLAAALGGTFAVIILLLIILILFYVYHRYRMIIYSLLAYIQDTS